MHDEHFAPLSPYKTGLRGCCPRCGEGKLFTGFLTLRPHCDRCGLDYSFVDSADGPAVFVVLIVGFVVVGAALVTEMAHRPPYWPHALLRLPLTLLMTLGMVRPLGGLTISLHDHPKAADGRLADR